MESLENYLKDLTEKEITFLKGEDYSSQLINWQKYEFKKDGEKCFLLIRDLGVYEAPKNSATTQIPSDYFSYLMAQFSNGLSNDQIYFEGTTYKCEFYKSSDNNAKLNLTPIN